MTRELVSTTCASPAARWVAWGSSPKAISGRVTWCPGGRAPRDVPAGWVLACASQAQLVGRGGVYKSQRQGEMTGEGEVARCWRRERFFLRAVSSNAELEKQSNSNSNHIHKKRSQFNILFHQRSIHFALQTRLSRLDAVRLGGCVLCTTGVLQVLDRLAEEPRMNQELDHLDLSRAQHGSSKKIKEVLSQCSVLRPEPRVDPSLFLPSRRDPWTWPFTSVYCWLMTP